MEKEFKKIKLVLDMYEGKQEKIDFLLRQVALLIKSRDYYKGIATSNLKEKK